MIVDGLVIAGLPPVRRYSANKNSLSTLADSGSRIGEPNPLGVAFARSQVEMIAEAQKAGKLPAHFVPGFPLGQPRATAPAAGPNAATMQADRPALDRPLTPAAPLSLHSPALRHSTRAND